MSELKVVPLGAGQDVGRSCILVTIGGKNIMFDCGMHMGYHDDRRFPDFSYISKSGRFTEIIDCVIISHFHLDHCGALPYFTEMCGYDGPVYMTHPTKAIVPILLEDYRKITVERKGDTNFFTAAMIKACMKKVIGVNLYQTIQVDDELQIKAFYAGHVLGAAMFYVRVGNQSVVYTGDYNSTPDRHLGGAWIEKVRPDLFITETTYATTIRDSKRGREREFLKRIHECVVGRGGKVLIPVFALGRAQELCLLIDTYWERMNLGHVPVYFSAGLTEKANNYYKLFINWTNQKVKQTFVTRNMFDFKHIRPYERGLADTPGPMVLFATPGMLHAGTSLEVFKKWAPDERNLVILPGYCVVGTVGNKLLAGRTTPSRIEVDKGVWIDIRCQVKSLSFSAHADAKGILQLIRQAEPKNVLLVHGEKTKMRFLKEKIIEELKIPCFDPPNGVSMTIKTSRPVPVDMSINLLKRHRLEASAALVSEISRSSASTDDAERPAKRPRHTAAVSTGEALDRRPIDGVLLFGEGGPLRLVTQTEALQELGTTPHRLRFTSTRTVPSTMVATTTLPMPGVPYVPPEATALSRLYGEIARHAPDVVMSQDLTSIMLRSVTISTRDGGSRLAVTWSFEDDALARKCLQDIDGLFAAEAARERGGQRTKQEEVGTRSAEAMATADEEGNVIEEFVIGDDEPFEQMDVDEGDGAEEHDHEIE